ncbi:MAG TPA: response regulator [Tepidisphaeraceae bacterium]|jgi:DNA-binding NtrC family response regulator
MSGNSRPMTPVEARLLVVEDEPRLRELLVRMTGEWGFRTTAVWSGEEAVRLNASEPFDIAILDYHLPSMNGMETLKRLRARSPALEAIVLTAHAQLDVAKEAIHLDVVEFLTKPCQRSELEQALDRALRRRGGVDPVPLDLPDRPTSGTSQGAKTIEVAERELILESLARHHGNRAAAARELGITRRTLHNKINIYQDQGFPVP